ncbi:aspartic proteinase CDR1-like [Beta vulgaris subsp. vulgaris]|uniref:aspartic proteinase CDR1-like n=1 Tax=Beta vulgaris subsp. vulgaris TaxID=3555 RepID=UPI0020372D1E|nr:aspartic proteinase CDR1-like [Beta vulgaris subsp. vulgaris]
MHALSCFNNIVIVFLVSSLILPSPNKLFSVEARNLVSCNGVFKVNLIHRDSPLSPYYNSSLTPRERVKRAPLGSISRGHTNDVKLSALISNGGDYLIQFSLGTPQVEFIAAADTGSDLIWIQCSPCDTCLSTASQSFDPTQSSTYNVIPCTSSSCNNYIDLTTGCAKSSNMDYSSLCVYYSSYGDGTQSLGILATETISLPTSDATSKSLPSSVFGCGFDNKGRIGYQGEGVVGLGQGPASLISQLGSNINYKFSYCLAPLSSGVTSKLTFGADVTSSAVVSTPFTTANDNTFYYLSLNGITVGDQDNSVQVPTKLNMIIDSGTTYTYLPSNIYESVKSSLETAIELTPVESPVESLDLCYDTIQLASSGAQFNPPDMVFHFQGADVVLKALNTFRDVGDGVSCLAIVANNDQPYIFGNIAQVNFEVGYDLQAKQVSFAPADCTNF